MEDFDETRSGTAITARLGKAGPVLARRGLSGGDAWRAAQGEYRTDRVRLVAVGLSRQHGMMLGSCFLS
jgi:hypothetical protein